KLVEKGDGRVLYVFEPEARRARRVDDERDGEGLFDGREVGDTLLDAVLEDAEVLLLQSADETAVAVEHRDGHGHQRGVDAHDLVLAHLLCDLPVGLRLVRPRGRGRWNLQRRGASRRRRRGGGRRGRGGRRLTDAARAHLRDG